MNKTIEYIKNELKDCYPAGEINSMIQLIFSKVCGMSRNEQILHNDRKLSENESKKITEITERLKQMEPLQYILGETEFYSIPIVLNSRVLIPRPETEELVDMIIKSDYIRQKISGKRRLKILDIGAGSGCISIALAKHIRKADVYAADIDENSLDNILINRNILGLSNLEPLRLDILRAAERRRVETTFDLIVSNPPYVLDRERESMSDNVLKYEPQEAIFVPDRNPLKFYKPIADLAQKRLVSGGFLFLEINPLYCIRLIKLLQGKGLEVINVFRDLSGKRRFMTAKK
ncbi:MAG: peptide chain release factor N(5)-glutamine methyltransferase [Tannerella sp.]|jgi:release factor glutamine methyltransferase|nr:peptide chain release factor N(5)-glutamine methyltransferase [Tannerella sp.]